MALASPRYRVLCRVVLLFALGALLGHVCALEAGHPHPTDMASSADSADTQSGGPVGIHGASCEGLKPASVSPAIWLIGARPLALPCVAVSVSITATGIASAPVPRHALFVLHGALLI